MEPLVVGDDVSVGEGLPDTPHVEIMFDALNDTIDNNVAGNEGLVLSGSQIYAQAVLSANGVKGITGNEGFFSKVAETAKSIYDYIVKMFKSVWGFFFNRDAPKEVAKAQADVKVEQSKLADFKAAKPEAVEQAKHFIATAKAADPDVIDLDKDTIEEIIVKLKSGNSAKEKEAVTQISHVAPKANKKAQTAYSKSNQSVIDTKQRLLRVIEGAEKNPLGEAVSGVTGHIEETARSVLAVAVKAKPAELALIKVLESHKEIKSIQDADLVGAAILNNLSEIKVLSERYKGHTARVQEDVNEAKKDVSEASNPNSSAIAKKRLSALRHVLTFTTNIAQAIKKTNTELLRLQKDINHIFGVK